MLVGVLAATAMAALGIESTTSAVSYQPNTPNQPETATLTNIDFDATSADSDDLINSLKFDDYGFIHIADDGVAPSYDSTGKVLDAVRLTNAQLKLSMSNLPSALTPARAHLNDVFATVSGYDVEDADLLDPPTHLLPIEFRPNAMPYTNSELEASVATAQAKIKTAMDLGRSPNPLSRAKRALMPRTPLTCDELICNLSYDCKLWGNADYDCGRCARRDELMTGQGRCNGGDRPAGLLNPMAGCWQSPWLSCGKSAEVEDEGEGE